MFVILTEDRLIIGMDAKPEISMIPPEFYKWICPVAHDANLSLIITVTRSDLLRKAGVSRKGWKTFQSAFP